MKKKGNTESSEEVLKMEEKEKMKKKEKREGRIRRRYRKPKAYSETEKVESARDKILFAPAASNCPTANS